MYIATTTRCNMECSHCCFAATNKGQDMDHEVFCAALNLAEERDEPITIGGGEPTCNKFIIDFAERAVQRYLRGNLSFAPLIITNGKLKGKTNALLQLAKRYPGALELRLSQDEWHDPIDPETVWKFQELSVDRHGSTLEYNPDSDVPNIGFRTVKHLGPWGRAADPARGLPIWKHHGSCCCDDLFIDPDGSVYSCGCKHIKLGHILESSSAFDDYCRDHAHEGGQPDLKLTANTY